MMLAKFYIVPSWAVVAVALGVLCILWLLLRGDRNVR